MPGSLPSAVRPTDLAEKNMAVSPPGGGIGGAGILFICGESLLALGSIFPPAFGVCGAFGPEPPETALVIGRRDPCACALPGSLDGGFGCCACACTGAGRSRTISSGWPSPGTQKSASSSSTEVQFRFLRTHPRRAYHRGSLQMTL